jgi:hypothetical protein
MTCPTCRKPVARPGNKFFPFCRERCQLVDLGRWLNEDYRIPEPDDSEPDSKQGASDADA